MHGTVTWRHPGTLSNDLAEFCSPCGFVGNWLCLELAETGACVSRVKQAHTSLWDC